METSLKRPTQTFSLRVLNQWAEAHDGISFSIKSDPYRKNDDFVRWEGSQVIFTRDPPTLQDILKASQLVRENTPTTFVKDKKTEVVESQLLDFARKLYESAILLTKSKLAAQPENAKNIETLFALGSTLFVRATKAQASPIALTYEQIKLLEIPTRLDASLPPRDEYQMKEYTDSLYLFLMGKEDIEFTFTDQVGIGKKPNTRYQELMEKVRFNRLSRDEWADVSVSALEKDVLGLLNGNIDEYVFDDLSSSSGLLFSNLAEKRVISRLEEAILGRGASFVETNLDLFDNDFRLGTKLVNLLEKEFGISIKGEGSGKDWKLFETVGKTLEKLGETATTNEKLRVLWDFVRSYQYEVTYKPRLMVQNKTMECALSSYLFFLLARRFLADEVDILSVVSFKHISLLAVEKKSHKEPRGKFVVYAIDPTGTKNGGERVEDRVRLVGDFELLIKIHDQYHTFGSVMEIRIKDPRTLGEHEGVTRVIPGLRGIKATLWNNVGYVQNDRAIRYSMFQKAIESESGSPHYLNNLGIVAQNDGQALHHFKKALEIDPTNPIALSQLAKYFLRHNVNSKQLLNRAEYRNLVTFLKERASNEIVDKKISSADAQTLLTRLGVGSG